MKNYLSILILLALIASCKSKIAPASERISKNWSAREVKENNVTVFEKGSSGNIKPGYINYRLELSGATGAHLNEFEGSAFNGEWNLSSDSKVLTLSGLVPQPTSSKGILEFEVIVLSDDLLQLRLRGTSVKTGGSVNEYFLESF